MCRCRPGAPDARPAWRGRQATPPAVRACRARRARSARPRPKTRRQPPVLQRLRAQNIGQQDHARRWRGRWWRPAPPSGCWHRKRGGRAAPARPASRWRWRTRHWRQSPAPAGRRGPERGRPHRSPHSRARRRSAACQAHEQCDRRQGTTAPMAIGIETPEEPADRPRDIGCAEAPKDQQGHRRRRRRPERRPGR